MNRIQQYQQWIEKEIRRQRFGTRPDSLYEPIRYLMQLPGKRLRPMLTLLAYSLYRRDVRSIVPYAVAVEAFHNFTLMHDDIMDNAPLRRGKETVHQKWNTNTAILSGDVMLIKVYAMLQSLPAETLQRVMIALNKCATEVCEGQQWDMEFEKQSSVPEAQYITMIRQKTAVLLGFSLELGALLAGAPTPDGIALRKFGTNIGIGFQLRDDLLDAYGDPGKFGKQLGGDILANKKTFLLIKAQSLANQSQRKALSFWLSARKHNRRKKVEAITSLYTALGVPALTERKANQFFKAGFRVLDTVHCSDEGRATLRQFAETLISRQS